jgi:hypothetical protein
MRNSRSQVDDYRNRAEELRVLAESMNEGDARETMLRVAGEYLHMAERLENAAED